MLSAIIGGAMIGVGGKMLFDKAVKALANAVVKKTAEVEVEAAEAAKEETATEATEGINSDEVE